MKMSVMISVGMVLSALVHAVTAEDVVTLTADNFDEFVDNKKDYDLAVVEFYAPWCGHCKKLAPEYEKAASLLKEKTSRVLIAKVDADHEKDLGSRYDVSSFPTLMLFRGLDSKAPYEGPRDASGIASYVLKQLQPAYTEINKDSLDDWLNGALEGDVNVVGYTPAESKERKVFLEFAKKNRDKYRFASADAETAKIILYKPYGEEPVEYDGKISSAKVSSFLKANKFPLVGEISQANFKDYMARPFPLAWTFIDLDDEAEKIKSVLLEIAVEFKGRLSVVWLDGKAYKNMAERLGMQAEGRLPFLSIENSTAQRKWAFDNEKPFTAEELRPWVADVLEEKVPLTLKSAELPAEPEENGVRIVVGRNFEDIVLKGKEDVFIEFYAPWCGHCKNLAPIYEDLAKTVASENLILAKMDATVNDVPVEGFEVKGFPTLYFVPASDKKPIPYSGERTKKDMLSFLKKHSTASVNDEL